MHSEFLKSFTKIGLGPQFRPNLNNGTFTLLNKATASTTVLGSDYTSQLELATDFQGCGFKPTVRMIGAKSDFTGINKRYIDDRGMYDLSLAVDEFTKRVPGTRLTKNEIDALAKASPTTDSHDAFLFNMLITWYKAVLYRDSGRKDKKILVRQGVYSDSHMRMSFRDTDVDMMHEIELGPPIEEDMVDYGIYIRDANHYWDMPYAIRYDNTNPKAAGFYVIHAQGRTQVSPLNVDIPLPGIAFNMVAFEPLGGDTVVPAPSETIDWGNDEQMWLWIKSYVYQNRLETAFAAVFETFASLCYQPLPSYQESHVWEKAQISLNLATFSPTRARIPSNLDGEPYAQGLEAHDFTLAECSSPRNYLVVAAVMNYMAWMGMYVSVTDYASTTSDWRLAYTASDDIMATLSMVHARAAMISAIVGKEMTTCMTENCHVTYSLSLMAGVERLLIAQRFEDGPTTLKVDGIYPYVSGSLILGTVTLDSPAVEHLAPRQHVQLDAYGVINKYQAIKVANIYRLFGNEVCMSDDRSGEQLGWFTNVRECIVCPTQAVNNLREYDTVQLTSSTRRLGRGTSLPDISSMRPNDTIEFVVTAPNIHIMEWRSKTSEVRPSLNLQRHRATIKYKVNAKTIVTEATFGMRYKPNMVKKGFRPAIIRPAPEYPVATSRPVVVPPLDDQEDAEAVDVIE